MTAPKTDRSFETLPGVCMDTRARYAAVNWDKIAAQARRPRQRKQARPQKRKFGV